MRGPALKISAGPRRQRSRRVDRWRLIDLFPSRIDPDRIGDSTFFLSKISPKNKKSSKIGEKAEDKNQAFDVEFGFENNKLWLFQIRPFVENKQAKSSDYLNSITPKIADDKQIKITEKL